MHSISCFLDVCLGCHSFFKQFLGLRLFHFFRPKLNKSGQIWAILAKWSKFGFWPDLSDRLLALLLLLRMKTAVREKLYKRL